MSRKIRFNKFINRVLVLLLVFSMVIKGLPVMGVQAATPTIDASLDEIRESFFDTVSDDVFGLETINIDTSRIIHVPQFYLEPEPPPLFAPFNLQPPVFAGPFNLGDTRYFRASTGSNQERIVLGRLVGKGEHTNIWVLDDSSYHSQTGTTHNANCHLPNITPVMAQQLATDFDEIYKRMTGTEGFGTHNGVVINTGFSNMPSVGDLGNDSTVNFLLYDIYGDGGPSGGSYTAGFFSNGDFFTFDNDGLNLRPPGWVAPSGTNANGSFRNGLDMLHIDIGHNQGYTALTSTSDSERLSVYGTLAHELQHLLFYMYFGVYVPSAQATARSYSWINESLSAIADTFYVQEGAELAEYGRLRSAAQNSYLNGTAYGDFLNFNNSLKNYGMVKLLAMLMYKTYGSDYTTGIYNSFQNYYPAAQNNAQLAANSGKMTNDGHDRTVGRFLRAGTGLGNEADFSDTLPLFYYLFMEGFAADGGMIKNTIPVQSTKFYKAANPVDNLWAIRPVIGVTGGRVYLTMAMSSWYNTQDNPVIPTLNSGGSISLSGYGTSNVRPASHEMLYKLSGGGAATPVLNITAPNDGNSGSRYYVAVPKDPFLTSPAPHSSGVSGADVYPLTKGVPEAINTNGQAAYLFVATLNQNVSSSISYTWQAAGSDDLVGIVTLSPGAPRFGQSITANVTANGGPYTYAWTSGGSPVGGNNVSYTTVAADIGNVIAVSVTSAGRNGVLTAQTAALAKAQGPSAPAAPTMAAVSSTSVTLNTIAGCEYSNGGIIWQDSPIFTGLLVNTNYQFFQRIKATDTTEASNRSPVLNVRTLTSDLYTNEADHITNNNITVSINVAADAPDSFLLNQGQISVRGAALNTPANGTAVLQLSKPAVQASFDSSRYDENTMVQVDIKLMINGTPVPTGTNLTVPIEITIPIPSELGGNLTNFRILHFLSNGSHDVIKPVLNGDGTCTFTVKHFSTFGFANLISGFGTNPPTGVSDITNATIAMYMLIVLSVILWGYIFLRVRKINGQEKIRQN